MSAEKVVTGYIDKAVVFSQEFISKHGPQAWEMVIYVYMVRGIQKIIFGAMLVIIGLIGFKMTYYFHRRVQDGGWDEIAYMPATLISLTALTVFVIGGSEVVNVWNWVSIFKPDIAVANDVFTRIVK